MSQTELRNLTQGDERAYLAMAEAAQASVTALLIPFKAAADPEGLLRAMSTEDFLKRFIVYADKFTLGCCLDYAKIMRQCAIVAEIRGTPTTSLAKQIRAEVFEPLDGILTDYIRALRQLEMDLSTVSSELRDSSVVDAAMKGAAIGQLAGGLGSSGRTLGTVNALLQAGAEAEKRLALLQQKIELMKQAESLTIPKIVEYLKAVRELPERLLDYGCAKCFGGQVSFERQQKVLESISSVISQELEGAINLTLALPEAEKKVEKERFDQAKAQEEENRKQQELESKKRAPALGLFLLALSVGLVMLSFKSCGANGSEDEMMVSATFGLLLFIGAVVAFVYGIMRFFDRRGAGERGERLMRGSDDHVWDLQEGDAGHGSESREAYEKKFKEWQDRDWPDWLAKRLIFPFVATLDEDAVDVAAKVSLQKGGTLEVMALAKVDVDRGITVKVRGKERVRDVPLANIEVVPESDPNFWPVREYGVWFANRFESNPEPEPSSPATEVSLPNLPQKESQAGKGLGWLGIFVLCVAIYWLADIAGCNPVSQQNSVSQNSGPKLLSKAEWREKVRPYWNPGGEIRVTTIADFKTLVGEPSSTQTIEGKAYWYYNCSDGTIQVELVDPNMPGVGGKMLITTINDY